MEHITNETPLQQEEPDETIQKLFFVKLGVFKCISLFHLVFFLTFAGV